MFRRFTQAARTAVVRAQQEARDQGSPTVGVEHLLVGVLSDPRGAPVAVLARFGIDAASRTTVRPAGADLDDEALSALGIDLDEVRRRAEEAFGPGALDEPSRMPGPRGHLPLTAGSRAALSQAVRAAASHGDRGIGPAQIFLGLLTDESVVLRLSRTGRAPATEELVRLVRDELDQAA